MKKSILVVLMVLIGLGALTSLSFGDDIKGYIIPEYYSVASHHSGEEGIEGQHGFWVRRVYFGYNTNLGDGWSARVRFEMNSPAYEKATLNPYVKNLHLKKKLGGGASLLVGIMEPPSFNKIEKFWGLRFVEKTAPDFFKLASSRDFGIALDGKTKNGLVYTVMYGNYSSNKGESDKGKAVYGRIGWETKTMYLEANGHFAASGSKDITYLTAFGGFKGGWGRVGVGYHNFSIKPEGEDSESTGVISAFGAVKLNKKGEIFARYDHFTDFGYKNIGSYVPVPSADYKSRFLIAGLNYKIHKNINISPNVKYVFYEEDMGDKPSADLHINLTAKISFKSVFGK